MFQEDNEFNGKNVPLFHKGLEIEELTKRILDLILENDELLQEIARVMYQDAINLSIKVSSAEAADLYDIRMENAAIIRRSARELIVHTHSMEMHGFKETQYFHLLREAVEEYRVLFIDWVSSFDPWNYVIDRWGLFNPPGVGPDDIDPDDLIPPDQTI